MDYEEIVAAIAQIDAALNIMGLVCPHNVDPDTYRALRDARNDLNTVRLGLLGNGQDRPYHVADLALT
ncbi:hypothetical protein AN189_03015 [Loktanella sp. 3ANDIMAR09]|uniref:hypothetical protein n=1 Tax=Loktanella sp. 3ANDIMAR09 TaxID=1225657 RepID=UPI0006FBEFAE|nr:hypothetical protein [Loktanella sp. 3ANDIMAR09]KQI69407.1 hypothetical protein AN189_03015 [Loktanella sp. 3ANDIMAR09]